MEGKARCILLYNKFDYDINRYVIEQNQKPRALDDSLKAQDEMKECADSDKGCMVQRMLTALEQALRQMHPLPESEEALMINILVPFQSGVHTFKISQTLTPNRFTAAFNRAHARGKLIHNNKGQESYVLLDQQIPGITVTLYRIHQRRICGRLPPHFEKIPSDPWL